MVRRLSISSISAVFTASSLLLAALPAHAEGSEGCFFEASYLEARIAGETPEARRAVAETRGVELHAAAAEVVVAQAQLAAPDVGHGVEAAEDADIHSDEEALAKAGMCVYPPGYIDTLAQGSMAPADTADAGHAADTPQSANAAESTEAALAWIVAARLYAGGMTALPVPLSALIEGGRSGG